MPEVIRIFVGSSPDSMDLEAEIALESSIRARTKAPVEITWMRLSKNTASPFFSDPQTGEGYRTAGWTTPFSQFRWKIPALCAWRGRAIYLDVDITTLADVQELHEMPMDRGIVWRGKSAVRACVMVIDCAAAKPYHPFDRKTPMQPFPLDANWNCLDGEDLALGDRRMKLLHFTSINSQPHLPLARERLARAGAAHWFTGPIQPHWRPELTALWHEEYAAGLRDGYGETPTETFGPFPLQSHANFRGVRPAAR